MYYFGYTIHAFDRTNNITILSWDSDKSISKPSESHVTTQQINSLFLVYDILFIYFDIILTDVFIGLQYSERYFPRISPSHR